MSQSTFLRYGGNRGISLIELTAIIVVAAIVMATVMQSMTHNMKQTRERATEREMQMLQYAIAGNPDVMSVAGGMRSDFGYVGDVGAFPPDLDALVRNPGGYTTWDGPYIPPGFAADTVGFKTDAWGTTYTYNGGLDIVSNGSGHAIQHGRTADTDDYLLNPIYGVVRDLCDSVPGPALTDSVRIEIAIPDGTGSTVTKAYHPDSAGNFVVDSVPVGRHPIRAIYTPENDTLLRYARVMPRHSSDDLIRFNFAVNYFSAEVGSDSMLTLVEGSQAVYGQGSDCNNIEFEIRNNTGEDVELTSLELTWSSPTAYYQEVWWSGSRIWDSATPRNGSGDVATFSSAQTITSGATVTIKVEKFLVTPNGNGSKPDMSGTVFTVLFSDGSTFDITMGECI